MNQKVIKIGTSQGVLIPKKQLADKGVVIGDEIKLNFEPVSQASQKQNQLMGEYQNFVKEYGQTLKNLAKR